MKFDRVFVLLTAVIFLCASRPALAAPALWLVQGPVGRVYLFGTIHVLRDNVQWRSAELAAAMRESKDLYLELADPSNASAIAAPLLRLGYDPTHLLSSKLSKTDLTLLDAALLRDGLGEEDRYEHMQPWLIAMLLEVRSVTQSGYAAGNGVDMQVRKDFLDAGKPVVGLESAETQLHVFADMTQAQQIALLEDELKTPAQTGVSNLDALVQAWQTGDQSQLAAAIHFDKYPKDAFDQRMLAHRNEHWASELSARLQQPGTSFVSVGAAHMLGPEGLPALLAAKGFTVSRVAISQTQPALTSAPAPLSPATPLPAPPSTVPATPIPQFVTPPHGWTPHKMAMAAGTMRVDMMWTDPNGRGELLASHIDVPQGVAIFNLDTFDALFQQGLLSDGSVKIVQPSKRVKICNGTQDGTLTVFSAHNEIADVTLAMSDRGYVAQYMRPNSVPEDPAGMRAVLSLCAPAAPSATK